MQTSIPPVDLLGRRANPTSSERTDRARLASARTIFVVPCSKTKAEQARASAIPAHLVYTGTSFRIAARTLHQFAADWMILSGGYAFIQQLTPIWHYERRIAAPANNPHWYEQAREAARERYPFLWTVPRLVVLGSRHYAQAAKAILTGRTLPVETPLVGLSIGHMNRVLVGAEWLNQPSPILCPAMP